MADFEETSRPKLPLGLIACYALMAAVGVGLGVWGIVALTQAQSHAVAVANGAEAPAPLLGAAAASLLLASGVLVLVLSLALLPVALLLKQLYAAQKQAAINSGSDLVVPLLESVNDRLLISDLAKRTAYREKEREVLRDTIRRDIEKKDYDAAMVLVAEMSRSLGYRDEAEKYREEIEAMRAAARDERITASITRIDELLAEKHWEKAAAEAAKIQRLYAESPRVKDLNRRVEDARERYKHILERDFLEAAKREDVETAMDKLKEMDKYLSEEEAAPFMETARGVIGKKRQNLGVQFKLACQDKDWHAALTAGEQIIKDFPTSKMAEEVRQMLDVLRERAATQVKAGSGEYDAIETDEMDQLKA